MEIEPAVGEHYRCSNGQRDYMSDHTLVTRVAVMDVFP